MDFGEVIEEGGQFSKMELGKAKGTGGAVKCEICGREVARVFQQNACKSCLAGLFKKYIQLIDDFQSSHNH